MSANPLGPGVHRGVPMADYLALPYLSASKLEILRRSPLQLKHAMSEPPKTSPALERGTALHMAILEPLLFEGHYVTIGRCHSTKKDGDRCGYQGSVHRDGKDFCLTHDPQKGEPTNPNVQVLAEKEMLSVIGMRDAILAHKRARSLFEGAGDFEVTVIWDDPDTGVRCKARPDRLIERAKMMVDIKTSREAGPDLFPRLARNLGYFRKLAFYRGGLRAVDWPLVEIAVLAIEPEAPHDLAPYLVEQGEPIDKLARAEATVAQLIRRFKQCTDDNSWPGYASSEDGFLLLADPDADNNRLEIAA